MENDKQNMLENIESKFQRKTLKFPEYGLLYFDHLHGEYCLLISLITDEEDKKRLDEIHTKRKTESVTWDDIYSYELILLKYQNFDTLKSKVWSLRNRYRHIAGQIEYDQYLASKAIDLATINRENGLAELRTDYTYLLREFCLLYSFMAAREGLRDRLLKRGALLTVGFLLFAVLVGILIPVFNNIVGDTYDINLSPGFISLIVVVFAGMTGAFVSMQQRIQSAPSQGDPLYNLSMLTHGWFGIFLSPLSGAIFALILYMFFAGGLITGSIFPVVRTVPFVPCGENCVTANIGLVNFLNNTGPNAGLGYALLLIWSFIAGFAERFVPDKLNKLVTKDEKEKASQAVG
ncbi:MAG: hypothetical protein M3Q99_16970 [Acidobacteriota bacterium]|nr:hypothetical protein [Acidobacteriota bacterium]